MKQNDFDTGIYLFPPQEEAGSPTLGSLGPKGDKGEPVMCAQLIVLG